MKKEKRPNPYPILLLIILIPFWSIGCIADKTNQRTFTNQPFVCKYNLTKDKKLLQLRDNTLIYTQKLENTQIKPGTSGIALHFTIDYDNQTTSEYYEVTNFEYIEVPQYTLKIQGKTEPGYQDTIQGIIPMGYIDSILFINAKQKIKKGQEFVSNLLLDSTQITENEVYILQFETKNITPGTENEINNTLQPNAFNIAEFIRKYGIEQNKTELKVRIKYQTSWNKEHQPIYETTPILYPLMLK